MLCQNKQTIDAESEISPTVRIVVFIREDWYDINVMAGDCIQIIGEIDTTDICIIDNVNRIVIVNPDHLVSATTIADSFGCLRRAVLQDRVKVTGELSRPMVHGVILHEVCQASLIAKDFSTSFLTMTIEDAIDSHIEQLYVLKQEPCEARAFLASKIPAIQRWAEHFVTSDEVNFSGFFFPPLESIDFLLNYDRRI